MIAALPPHTQVVLIVAAFFALLAILAFLRVVLRRDSRWRKVRVGVFVERDHAPPSEDVTRVDWPERDEQ
jgi:hypothetical protein